MPRNARAIRLPVVLLAAWALIAGACSLQPTPYQPMDEEGGYEESRLQENMLRVSFKGNRVTPEGNIIDFLLLRCAEVTLANGYTHFQVVEDYGRTQMRLEESGGPRFGLGLGFGASRGSSFWGMGMGTGTSAQMESRVDYHLGMFVVRMLNEGESGSGKGIFDARFLKESLQPKADESRKQAGLK